MSIVNSSPWRAFVFLVWLSFQRQARAHLMVWIALGLLGLSMLLVGINTQAGLWTKAAAMPPRGKGPTFMRLDTLGRLDLMPLDGPDAAIPRLVHGAYLAIMIETESLNIFSNLIIFSLFTTFLLPIWSVSFATEGLGREREGQNLVWVLTRPIPRGAIFLAKYVALLPWCLLLNVGGFVLICLVGGRHGLRALELYWPAVLWGTLAFSALFHLIGAMFRRSAVVALLYAFFLETIMGNMPGHFKRLSLSFYVRCLMFDRAHDFDVYPDRPQWYMPVDGTTAWLALAGVTIACLIVGAIAFTRNEYLDVN